MSAMRPRSTFVGQCHHCRSIVTTANKADRGSGHNFDCNERHGAPAVSSHREIREIYTQSVSDYEKLSISAPDQETEELVKDRRVAFAVVDHELVRAQIGDTWDHRFGYSLLRL